MEHIPNGIGVNEREFQRDFLNEVARLETALEPFTDLDRDFVTDANILDEGNLCEILSHEGVLSTLLSELEPISFRQEVGLVADQKITQRQQIVICIDKILEAARNKHWSFCIHEERVYTFNGAYWKQVLKSELLHFLGLAAEHFGVDKFDARYHTFRVDLLKQFITTAYLPKPERNSGEVLINLLNGTFVIKPDDQQLKGFDKIDFLTYQLSFEFNTDAEAPIFESYLQRVLPDEDQRKILAEFIAYVFVKNRTLKLEKSLILYGDGANGKSVFFDVVTALLGSENVSNFSLQSLTNETGYHRAMLSNKLLNYASEISPRMDSTVFKQLVSGEGVEARLPYGQPFNMENYAKLIFNTNELPRDVEQNEAFFRRFIIVHFAMTIPENERDPQLSEKIISQELPGVFNWVLHGLQRLLQQGGFTDSEVVRATLQEYKKQSDSVQLFLEEEGYAKDVNGEIFLKGMYSNYKDYCIASGYKACSCKTFSSRLRSQGYELDRKRDGYVVGAKRITFQNSSSVSPASRILPVKEMLEVKE